MDITVIKKSLVLGVVVLFIGINIMPLGNATNAIEICKLLTEEGLTDQYLNKYPEYYALIIGVEKFEGLEFPEEDHIDETAIAVYEKLINSTNWKKENIKLLLNENATKENIQKAVTIWLAEKETKDDIVLYYFTGHSWKIPIHKRLMGHTYTFPYDVSDNEYSDDKITDVELDSWLDELESRHIAVVLDTCYSGRMLALIQPGRTILTAGGKYLFCPVDEDDALECGIFSYFLLQGFDGVADFNNDGWISAREIFYYARLPTFHFSFWKQFPFTRYLPLFIGPQLPYMYDRHLGELPLLKISPDYDSHD